MSENIPLHRTLSLHSSNDTILNIILYTIVSVRSGSELESGISPLNRAANSSSESLLKLGELKSLWLDDVECGDSGCWVAATVSSSTDVPGSCRTDGGWYTERRSSPLERTAGWGANISVLWSGWAVPLGKPVISHRNDHKPLLFPNCSPQYKINNSRWNTWCPPPHGLYFPSHRSCVANGLFRWCKFIIQK